MWSCIHKWKETLKITRAVALKVHQSPRSDRARDIDPIPPLPGRSVWSDRPTPPARTITSRPQHPQHHSHPHQGPSYTTWSACVHHTAVTDVTAKSMRFRCNVCGKVLTSCTIFCVHKSRFHPNRLNFERPSATTFHWCSPILSQAARKRSVMKKNSTAMRMTLIFTRNTFSGRPTFFKSEKSRRWIGGSFRSGYFSYQQLYIPTVFRKGPETDLNFIFHLLTPFLSTNCSS